MSESIFEMFGITAEEIPELSSGPQPGTYDAQITKAEIEKGEKEDGSPKINYIVYYTIEGQNFPVKEYISLPTSPKSQWDKTITGQKNGRDQSEYLTNEFKFGILTKRLLSLGIPQSAHNGLKPDDLVGLECVITLAPQKNNPQYNNVVKVAVKKEPTGLVLPTAAQAQPAAAAAVGGLWS